MLIAYSEVDQRSQKVHALRVPYFRIELSICWQDIEQWILPRLYKNLAYLTFFTEDGLCPRYIFLDLH